MIEQKKDKNIKIIFNALRNNTNEARVKYKNYSICPSTKLLLYTTKPKANVVECNNKIVIPSSLKEKCIRVSHLTHFGIDKTYQNLCRKFFWRGMFADVVNYIKSCDKCLTLKPQRVPVAPLQKTIIPTRPGQLLSLDLVGPFSNGKHILTVIDHFSKHLKLYALKNITAMQVV